LHGGYAGECLIADEFSKPLGEISMSKFVLVLVTILGLTAAVATADEVTLVNGDKLSGTIKSLADGKLTITTPEAGDVKIDASKIATFSTDAPIAIVLTDGSTVSQKVNADNAGGIDLAGGLLGNQHVKVSDIDTINVPPTVWAASVTFGGLLLRGNTFTNSINFGFDVSRTTKQDVMDFNGSYIYGTTKDRTTNVTTTSADSWTAEAKYEYNFTKKFYGFGDAQVSKDRLAFLDLQFIPSAGVGYRWFARDDLQFSTEGGIAWIYQKYDNGTPTREDAALRLAYHFNKNFNDKVSLFHDLTYNPSLDNINFYIVNTDIGIRSMMTTHFFGEFKFVLNYVSQPANNALHTDLQYQLNIGYKL
jgi:putative salt-induced outer membrane protein YdiY